MYDAFILNSAKGVNKRVLEKNGVFPEEYIFEKYNIDRCEIETFKIKPRKTDIDVENCVLVWRL